MPTSLALAMVGLLLFLSALVSYRCLCSLSFSDNKSLPIRGLTTSVISFLCADLRLVLKPGVGLGASKAQRADKLTDPWVERFL